MEILEKAQTNVLYIQCDDILTFASPYYYFKFTNHATNEEEIIELTNTTSSNPRIDIFNLTLPTDLDLDFGVYSFEVFESETTGSATLPPDALSLGNWVARVGAVFTDNDDYEPEGTDTVYQG